MTGQPPSPAGDRRAPGVASLAILTVCALAALATLLSLGTWQMQRLAWKEGLVARISARAHGPAEPLPPESAWKTFDAEAEEYRRVRLSGRYDFARQTLVHANGPGAGGEVRPGYVVITPMTLPDGAVVLVNRGFIPMEMRGALAQTDARSPAGATVTGLLRASQKHDPFVPANDPAREEWFTRDIGEIAAARGLRRVAPFIVDADAAPGYREGPRGGLTVLSFPNRHLEYAMTWFGLALALVAVYVAWVWRWARSRRESRAAP